MNLRVALEEKQETFILNVSTNTSADSHCTVDFDKLLWNLDNTETFI